MNEEKWIKPKICVMSLVKKKVRKMEDNIRGGDKEDEEKGGGICPGCGGEEEVPISI